MILFSILYPIILFFFTIFLLKLCIKLLPKFNLIDKPKKRSNHSDPIPRGGGLIVIPSIIFSIFFYIDNQLIDFYPWYTFCCIGLILFCISFIDDIYNLPAVPRLFTQIICISFLVFYIDVDVKIFLDKIYFFLQVSDKSIIFDYTITFLLIILWLWIINLFNFMDGMDGITFSQVCTFSIGIIILSLIGKIPEQYSYLGILMFSSMLGFFFWNAPPAKIFLGDVGSIPLGFIIGSIIMINLLKLENFIPLLTLILFHVMDASLTLIKRIFKKKQIFKAHSDHFYQKKIREGISHREVLTKINIINFSLIFLSLIYYKIGISSFILSIFFILISLYFLVQKKSQ